MLANEVKIAGETVQQRFGMASVHDDNKIFTGDVLFTEQFRSQTVIFGIRALSKSLKILSR